MGGLQPGHRQLALRCRRRARYEHARVAQVRRGVDGGHGHESDPWVLEVLGDGVRQHLAHGLVDPAHPFRALILLPPNQLQDATPPVDAHALRHTASSHRSTASAQSSSPSCRAGAHATASSVERCQLSWWATSATRGAEALVQPRLDGVELRALGLQRPGVGEVQVDPQDGDEGVRLTH